MKLHHFVLFFVLILYEPSTSQVQIGSQQRALSNSDAAYFINSFSTLKNPALKSYNKDISIDIFYSPSTYNFSELKNYAFGLILPKGKFEATIIFNKYGFELYNKSVISSNFSYSLQNNIKIGFGTDLFSLTIKNYGNSNSIIFSAGFVYDANELKIGLAFKNIFKNRISDVKESLPVITNLGLSYSVSSNIIAFGAVEIEDKYEENYKFGILVNPTDYISFLSGFQTFPESFSAGLSITFNKFEFGYSFFTHQYFPLTHQIGLKINSGIRL